MRRGDFSQKDATLGGFAGWYGDNAWVNGQLSYSRLGFDLDRDVVLGPATRTHHGSTDGSNLSVGVSGGWTFTQGSLQHGPVASLLWQKIDIDGFAESDPTLSTSLAYPDQDFRSLVGSIGWQLAYTGNQQLTPYARLTWDREFKDLPDEAFAQAQSIPSSLPYAVPGIQFDRSYATMQIGARTSLVGLDANVGATATMGQSGGNDASVFVTLGKRF
jgi:outer membrane lipase/esterase